MARMVMGKHGRIVVPAELRRELGMSEGDNLVARVEDGALIVETHEAWRKRLRDAFGHIPPERDLVAELIAERRAEAAREAAE